MARLNKEYELAFQYIEGLLSTGPVTVKAIQSEFPRGWRTVQKVKKDLGVKSIHTSNGWAWYLPDVNPEMAGPDSQTEIKGMLSPNDEPEQNEPIDTASLVRIARFRHLTHHDSEEKIFRQLQADCRQYPQTPPYTTEHIRAVVQHVVNGHVLPDRP